MDRPAGGPHSRGPVGMVPRGCWAPVVSTLSRVWKPGCCRLRWRRWLCAHLSGKNWVSHCLGRKENKQLSQTSGIQFQLNFLLQVSHVWATCFWEFTHLPGNSPSLRFLENKDWKHQKILSLKLPPPSPNILARKRVCFKGGRIHQKLNLLKLI